MLKRTKPQGRAKPIAVAAQTMTATSTWPSRRPTEEHHASDGGNATYTRFISILLLYAITITLCVQMQFQEILFYSGVPGHNHVRRETSSVDVQSPPHTMTATDDNNKFHKKIIPRPASSFASSQTCRENVTSSWTVPSLTAENGYPVYQKLSDFLEGKPVQDDAQERGHPLEEAVCYIRTKVKASRKFASLRLFSACSNANNTRRRNQPNPRLTRSVVSIASHAICIHVQTTCRIPCNKYIAVGLGGVPILDKDQSWSFWAPTRRKRRVPSSLACLICGDARLVCELPDTKRA